MALVEKSVLVPYSAAAMFALVDDIERYPEFLPWCASSQVHRESSSVLEATLEIRYLGIRQSFTTRNTLTTGERIDMALKDGPFSELAGSWHFTALREDACKVELKLAYRFSSNVLESLIGPVFATIAASLVDSFTRRAQTLYR
jgi:ribosome-associated toxin RatA of RatAB toxin-antitoxin module